MSPRVFRIMCIVVLLVLSGGILITGSLLAFWANSYCNHFVDFFFLGFGAAASICSCLGLFFLLKNHRRLYFLYMVFQVFLALSLVATLVVFWTLVATTHHGAERWWMRRFIAEDRWSSVRQCLRSSHFCRHFPDVSGCCQEPLGCETPRDGFDPDCFRWGGTDDTLCYMCFSCRRAIAYRLRADGRRVEPAIVIFTLVMVLVDIILVIEYYRRGALPSPEVPPGEQAIAAGVLQGEQQPAVGAAVVQQDSSPEMPLGEQEIAAGVEQGEQEPAVGAAEVEQELNTA